MKTLFKFLTNDDTFTVGLVLIALSSAIFLLPDLHIVPGTEGAHFSIFVVTFLISIIYFFIVWFQKIRNFHNGGFTKHLEYGFLHLILALISAYALNREFAVFEKSVPWMQVLLVLQSFVMIAMFYRNYMSENVRLILFGLSGIGFSLFLYLSVYLIKLYPLGLAAFFVLGISLHAFIPLLICITLLAFLFRRDNRSGKNIVSFFSGIIVSGAIVMIFLIQWSKSSEVINRAADQSILNEKNDLPEWVVVAQQMPRSRLSEKILKTGIVYSAAPEWDGWRLFDVPGRNFAEVRKHDPLVIISTFIFGRPKLPAEDRIKVLDAMYDARHYSQERLWSGNNLRTLHVISNVRIYPNLRMAYTEKTLTIRNDLPQSSWNRNQEAVYTFQLPEGAVVSSLSLWINGKEEKGILTTRQKADTAYRTIVGRESRDPSLIRWQEGNTVSVRVFPCSPAEDRRFKIGITSPLEKSGNQLIYHNIWFKGPACIQTGESAKIVWMDSAESISLPSGFKLRQSTGTYEGKYKADWKISMESPGIKANNFSFDGNSYRIEENRKSYVKANFQAIYLDINRSWNRSEYSRILQACQGRNVFAILEKPVKITEANKDEVFDELSQLNFSLFPFHRVKQPNVLVITRGTEASPNLADLSGCEFSDRLRDTLLKNNGISLFNLGGELSPYIRTLKELRAFRYGQGDSIYLTELLREDKFVANSENSDSVVINNADIRIVRTDGTSASNAPDHLMRLFAYNQVMASTGTRYLDKNFHDESIAAAAYKAWIVSPSTSLVVLETQKDYDRFGITDEGTSLKNASMKSSGAVPEPHEWVLIALLAGFVLFLYVKHK